MSKKVLVIGGSGFLGSHLVKVLKKNSMNEVSFTTSKTLNIVDDDVSKKTKDYDILINLTGQVSNPFSTCLNLNTIGIWKLVEACKKNEQKLIQASTTLVYGTADEVDEYSPLNPESPYATAKAAAERIIQQNLPLDQHLIIRFSNIYGPDQNKGLFWYLADCIRSNKLIKIPDNDGSLSRHYLDVRDAAQIVNKLIDVQLSGVVNVAGRDTYTIKALIKLCESILNRKIKVKYSSPALCSNIHHIKTDTLEQVFKPVFKHSVANYFKKILA